MTEKQYETILAALADKLKDREEEVGYLKARIYLLEKKLEEAEFHLNHNGKERPATLEIR